MREDRLIPDIVIPAQAGTHLDLRRLQGTSIKMDPSVRWDDERNRTSLKAFASAVLLTVLSLPALAADYTQAAGSSLTFAGNYQGETFTGRFPGFSTKLSFDPAQLASAKLDVTIPLATATTGNSDYDGEMRGAAFFNSAKFAQARYTATKFRSLGGNKYAADGTLSLRGVEQAGHADLHLDAGREAGARRQGDREAPGLRRRRRRVGRYRHDPERDRRQHQGRACSPCRIAYVLRAAASQASERIERPLQLHATRLRRATPARALRSELPARRRHR